MIITFLLSLVNASCKTDKNTGEVYTVDLKERDPESTFLRPDTQDLKLREFTCG